MSPPAEPIRVAIVGSVEYEHLEKVREFVRELAVKHNKQVVIVSGGSKGVDGTAATEAVYSGLRISTWRPDQRQKNSKNKRSGLKRNYQIVEDSDQVVGFWNEESGDVAHALKVARDRDKLWKVFGASGEELDIEDIDLGW